MSGTGTGRVQISVQMDLENQIFLDAERARRLAEPGRRRREASISVLVNEAVRKAYGEIKDPEEAQSAMAAARALARARKNADDTLRAGGVPIEKGSFSAVRGIPKPKSNGKKRKR